MTQNTISNADDTIDVRDVIARIEELRGERETAETYSREQGISAELMEDGTEEFLTAEYDEDAYNELRTLEALLEECKGNGGDEQYEGDWYPVTLIRESYFKDYAQELAEEIGAIPENNAWPCTCIDWEKAAHELQMDYTAVDFDGVTYFTR